ncbi:MAG: PAS domain S-box protein, partial [Chitinophagaceae bacterium]
LFQSMDQGFCVLEMIFDETNRPVDYRFLEINPVFEKQTGLKDATGKTARELVPELEPHWFERYGRVALTGKAERFVERSDTMGRWFEVYAYKSGGTESKNVAVLFTDITEQKEKDQHIRESEERFRALADESPMFVFIIDPNPLAPVAYWNKTWLQYTGQTVNEALGRAWDGIIHPDDIAVVMEYYGPAFEKRQPYLIPSVRVKRYDGQYRWHAFKGNPRYLPNGEFNGYVGVGFDVHEQRLAEEHVPLLFYAPNLITPQKRTETVSQIDVLPTIAGMLQMPYTNSTLGRDVLDTAKKENAAFIIYHAPGWIGVVNDDYFYRKNIRIKKDELVPVRNGLPVLTQTQTDSVKDKMSTLTSALYETARWMLVNNK